MNKKMSLMGVAGKIVAVLAISLIVTAGLNLMLTPVFRISDNYHRLVIIAITMAAAGFTLNLIASAGMLSAHRKGQLATGGLYSVFLNPMYTFQILVTIPGLLLLFNSWLIMLTIVPVFIAFKVFVKEEEKFLEEKFGKKYVDYRNKVLIKFL